MKYKFWDVPPIGYEHITPMQFKAMQGKIIQKGSFNYFHFLVRCYFLIEYLN